VLGAENRRARVSGWPRSTRSQDARTPKSQENHTGEYRLARTYNINNEGSLTGRTQGWNSDLASGSYSRTLSSAEVSLRSTPRNQLPQRYNIATFTVQVSTHRHVPAVPPHRVAYIYILTLALCSETPTSLFLSLFRHRDLIQRQISYRHETQLTALRIIHIDTVRTTFHKRARALPTIDQRPVKNRLSKRGKSHIPVVCRTPHV
jgi:hypothetical protein